MNHAIYVDPTPILVTPARILATMAFAKNNGLKPIRWRIGRDVKAHWMQQGITTVTPPGVSFNKPFTMGGLECDVDYGLAPNEARLIVHGPGGRRGELALAMEAE